MIITLPKTLFTFGEKVFRFLGSGGLSKAARGIGSRMVGLGKWLTANGKKVIQELFAGGASFNSKAVGAFFNNMVKSAKGAVQKAGSKIADSLLKFFLRPIKKIGSDIGHAIGTVVGAVLFEVVFALITAGIGLGVSAAKGVVKSIAGLLARAGRKIVQVARLVVGKVWNLLSKCGNGLVRFVMKMSPTLGKKFGELVGAVKAFVGKLWKRVRGAKAGALTGSTYSNKLQKFVNPWGSKTNCVGSSIAGDSYLAGRPATALPQLSTFKGFKPSLIEKTYNSKFFLTDGIDDISRIMSKRGAGSQGIVMGYKGANKPGHVFNVFNSNGKVGFFDFQSGTLPNYNGYKKFYLIFTK